MKPNLRNWSFISETYNDGVITFKKRVRATDEFGTPVGGGELEFVDESWFRRLGTTSEDVYHAYAMDVNLSAKVAIPGYYEKEDDIIAIIDGKHYQIHRIYYNAKKKESEFSLVVVDGENYSTKDA